MDPTPSHPNPRSIHEHPQPPHRRLQHPHPIRVRILPPHHPTPPQIRTTQLQPRQPASAIASQSSRSVACWTGQAMTVNFELLCRKPLRPIGTKADAASLP
ncbi:MAG: hypothetical protein WBA10_09370 [Elainellaceae cyanobacterium]